MSATPQKAHIISPLCAITATAESNAERTSELLYGQSIKILDHHGEYYKIRAEIDEYEGYVHKKHTDQSSVKSTHKILKKHSFIYPRPDFKTRQIMPLPFLAEITCTNDTQDGFQQLSSGSWIWKDDIAPKKTKQKDFVQTALKFLGLPYVWGGKGFLGLDCSALVQLSLLAAGIKCPRDSTPQRTSLPGALNISSKTAYKRGDIVFFDAHVGIMVDEAQILNATARTMDVRTEPLHEMAVHYKGGILAAKRINAS